MSIKGSINFGNENPFKEDNPMQSIENALQRIAETLMMGKEKVDTTRGKKNVEGIKDLIYSELKEGMGNMSLKELCKYFEI